MRDDYNIVFANDQNQLDGMAYIVTAGPSAAETSAPEPYAIRYYDYVDVGGVSIAQR